MPRDHEDSKPSIVADELRQLVERIERLEEDKAELAGDIKEIYAEAKGRGFDTKAIRTIVRLRKQDEAERREQQAILDLYMDALGMLGDTPLGRAAAEREFGESRITISGPGLEPIETTANALQQAAARMKLDAKVKRPRRDVSL